VIGSESNRIEKAPRSNGPCAIRCCSRATAYSITVPEEIIEAIRSGPLDHSIGSLVEAAQGRMATNGAPRHLSRTTHVIAFRWLTTRIGLLYSRLIFGRTRVGEMFRRAEHFETARWPGYVFPAPSHHQRKRLAATLVSVTAALIISNVRLIATMRSRSKKARSDCAAHSHVVDPGRSLLWSPDGIQPSLICYRAQPAGFAGTRSRRKMYRPVHPEATADYDDGFGETNDNIILVREKT